MSEADLKIIRDDLEKSFKQYDEKPYTKGILSGKLLTGKIYEAFVLLHVIKRLVLIEKKHVVLWNDNTLTLQSAPGDIVRSRVHFKVYRSEEAYKDSVHNQQFEIWTNIEFLTYSYKTSKRMFISQGDFHELDIAILKPNVSGKPSHDQVLVGIECKNTPFKKEYLRQLLGVRRELSVLSEPKSTWFTTWPTNLVNSDPPSVLMAFGTDSKILNYDSPGDVFTIQLQHLELKL